MAKFRYQVCKGRQVVAMATTKREAEAEARRCGGRVVDLVANPDKWVPANEGKFTATPVNPLTQPNWTARLVAMLIQSGRYPVDRGGIQVEVFGTAADRQADTGRLVAISKGVYWKHWIIGTYNNNVREFQEFVPFGQEDGALALLVQKMDETLPRLGKYATILQEALAEAETPAPAPAPADETPFRGWRDRVLQHVRSVYPNVPAESFPGRRAVPGGEVFFGIAGTSPRVRILCDSPSGELQPAEQVFFKVTLRDADSRLVDRYIFDRSLYSDVRLMEVAAISKVTDLVRDEVARFFTEAPATTAVAPTTEPQSIEEMAEVLESLYPDALVYQDAAKIYVSAEDAWDHASAWVKLMPVAFDAPMFWSVRVWGSSPEAVRDSFTNVTTEFALQQARRWIEDCLHLSPASSPAAAPSRAATAPAPQLDVAKATEALFPNRPTGTRNPISSSEFRYQMTIIAPISKTPVSFGWYTGSYNDRKYRGVAPNRKTQFVEGYFGNTNESVEEYSRQHMLDGILASADTYKKTGVGPSAYMAGPLVIATKRSDCLGTFSYRGGRSVDASRAWDNLVRHHIAENDPRFGEHTAVVPSQSFVQRAFSRFQDYDYQDVGLKQGKTVESVEPDTLTITSMFGEAQYIDRKKILGLGILLHATDDALRPIFGGVHLETPAVPPPGMFQHLDLAYVSMTEGTTLPMMLDFCKRMFARMTTTSEEDYHRAALLALKDNPTNPMPPEELEAELARLGGKRNNPGPGQKSVQPLLRFLSDPTWE